MDGMVILYTRRIPGVEQTRSEVKRTPSMAPLRTALLPALWYLGVMASSSPTFEIDYENDCFRKDGLKFQYVSGSIHYFRIPPEYWKDRLLKMYMAGLNAIQMYIPWNFHEETPGVYNFQNDRDVEHFLELAQQIGLLVILRPGPYICAEWDMGGLPAWLLQNPNITLRSSHPDYLNAVNTWLDVLLPKMRPRLYQNGGNIISVQVENEYGSYFACDYNYLRHLKAKFESILGDNVVLFTTDGNSDKELRCGTLQGLYATVDFGPSPNITKDFQAQRRIEPKGPLVNSEYYTGWLDYWGGNHSNAETGKVAASLEAMLEIGASVNMYMFEGGTNFGYWSGADYKMMFKPVTTSYDYDAPLSEAGDPTEKLYAIRSVISKFMEIPQGPMPPPTVKEGYGYVPLKKSGALLQLLDILSVYPPVLATFPLTFEQLHQYFGFVLYRTRLPVDVLEPTPLMAPRDGVHDFGYVMLNGEYVGVFEREDSLVINVVGRMGDSLDILVENMGRLNFGANFNDFKGLVQNISLGTYILEGWEMYPLSIDDAVRMRWIEYWSSLIPREKQRSVLQSTGPAFYSACFQLPGPNHDTFLKLPHWTKGQVWINGFNLGRYWPAKGPQQTLFVPATILEPSRPNNITLLELMGAPASPWALFIDRPILNGTGTKNEVVMEFN
ncbi:beta-galactosidase-1-like protein isoform X2 [Pleurodeles waltl]|uniref:beta-galactosidase-1-like protein isoform X2 n=1 Tax=Pleurodeles waltl TaxID=8319 RepID=UPI003709B1CA